MVTGEDNSFEPNIRRPVNWKSVLKGILILVIGLLSANLGFTFYILLAAPQVKSIPPPASSSTWLNVSPDMVLPDIFSESVQTEITETSKTESYSHIEFDDLTVDFSSLGTLVMVRVDTSEKVDGLLLSTQLEWADLVQKVDTMTSTSCCAIDGSVARVTLENKQEFTMLFSGHEGDATVALLKESI